MNDSAPQRDAALAEGLQRLAEHAAALREDVNLLLQNRRPHAAAVIDALAAEEAAKMLILLDIVRAGWSDPAATVELAKRFYSHLARGIYARAAETRPATFGELRGYVDGWRAQLFLDGPNDVDWIFRNQIMAAREDAMYVDYVVGEQGGHWTSPRTNAILAEMYGGSVVVDLATALARLGCTTVEGLQVVAAEWAGITVDDTTEWHAVERINRRVVQQLADRKLIDPSATRDEGELVYEQWTFPLNTIDLTQQVKVTKQELQERRDQWIADQI